MTVFYKLQKTTGGLPINSKMKVMPVRQITVDFESLAQKISVGTTFSSADLIGALDALKEAMIAERGRARTLSGAWLFLFVN